jgi:pimeloyl-ACP methyl ester carboxylesterase
MHSESAERLLQRLTEARGIAFRPDLLPQRRNEPVTKLTLSALHWQGQGPALLLLHGGALSANTWDMVCMALGDDARCVALDLPGHGDSGWLDTYGIDSAVADVAEFVGRLGWQKLHIVGMSLGGNIAFHFSSGNPQRVRSLTIVDVGPRVNLGATDNMLRFLRAADHLATFEELVGGACKASPRSDPELLRYRYLSLVRVSPDGTWCWRQHRHLHNFEDTLAKLREMPSLASRISCPVMIVRGGRSRVVTAEDMSEFASMFSRGCTVTIPEAGHNVQEDNPKALAEALRAHLREAEAV